MLADDPLGAKREQNTDPLPDSYELAMEAILKDPNQELVVACQGSDIIGMLQISFLPYLTYRGGWRALIEGVRVHRNFRSQGIGEALFRWAIERAKDRSCHVVQLTTDKSRPEALKFYERLGFQATHEGMKLHL